MTLKAPFPWFGGKSLVADLVWQRFGIVTNYVEPFFGSGAVLLSAPSTGHTETVNDLDGYVANFWRALQSDPDKVAHYADWPVNENDLHARHAYLVGIRDEFTRRLEGDPEYYDVKVAGWWVWGICCWIGSGWCSGDGPWHVIDGKLVHLGDKGKGVKRQRVHLGNKSMGVNRPHVALVEWLIALSARLEKVRICCGDWSRVCGPSVTFKHGVTGVFLDPPYGADADRDERIYRCDSSSVADEVREWAIENGDNPLMRIAVCGYEGEHTFPDGWECVAWKAPGGYGSRSDKGANNATKERIWFSQHCEIGVQQMSLL